MPAILGFIFPISDSNNVPIIAVAATVSRRGAHLQRGGKGERLGASSAAEPFVTHGRGDWI